MDAWIVAMWLSLPVAALVGYYMFEGAFWCFCWCFCKVDDYFRERHMLEALENLQRLEKIVERNKAA